MEIFVQSEDKTNNLIEETLDDNESELESLKLEEILDDEAECKTQILKVDGNFENIDFYFNLNKMLVNAFI